jgi:eukaryotic-like serine/threonine-protein kinase
MQLQRASSGSSDSPSPIEAKLPPEIVDKAVSRLCWVSVFAAVTAIVLTALEYFLQPEFAAMLNQPSLRLVLLAVLFFSAGFIAIQRNGWLKKEQLLDLGIIFQVFVAFAIAMFETSMKWDPSDPIRGHSGVAMWLLLCGLLLPKPPLHAAFAALASTAMWPLAYYINLQIFNYPPLPFNRLAVWIAPIIVMAIWMVLFNRRMVAMQIKQHKAEELGSYQLDTLIAHGGMGEVWRARHKMLARDAAIKLIRPDILNSSSARQENVIRKRFEREARATARLRSPHTVALYDFGETKDHTFYYVMELLEGVDLQSLVDKFGPLHPGRVRNILIEACESLEEAHRLGLVHRDIKPKNILLCQLGLQYDFVKVLDFGLVKALRQHTDNTLVTQDGLATGTPAYMAPEVAMGSDDIDGRADLYSLGCVAYFLLTGQLVFTETGAMAQAIAHVQQKPIPPSQRTELPIPAGLEAVIMQLLEKDPGNRIGSAYELARKLRAIRDIPEFCPYAAADWWSTNLPEVVRTPEREPTAPGSSDILSTAPELKSPVGMVRR